VPLQVAETNKLKESLRAAVKRAKEKDVENLEDAKAEMDAVAAEEGMGTVTGPGRCHMLVVEDDAFQSESILILCQQCGYSAHVASNGDEAMQIIKDNPKINLVLSDVMMEGMSGYDLLLKIRKLRKTMAVVLISAYESIDLVESCILSGADAYLMKPLRVHELRNIWQYVWRRRHEAALQLRNLSLLQATAQDLGHGVPEHSSPVVPAPNLAGASKVKGERQRLASRLSDLQVGLYKIFFYSFLYMQESIIPSLPPPICIAHTIAIPLHAICAI